MAAKAMAKTVAPSSLMGRVPSLLTKPMDANSKGNPHAFATPALKPKNPLPKPSVAAAPVAIKPANGEQKQQQQEEAEEEVFTAPPLSESHMYAIADIGLPEDWAKLKATFSSKEEHPLVTQDYMHYGIADYIRPDMDDIVVMSTYFVSGVVRDGAAPAASDDSQTHWNKDNFLRNLFNLSTGQIHGAFIPLHDSAFTPRFKAIVMPIFSKQTIHYSVLVYYLQEPHVALSKTTDADGTTSDVDGISSTVPPQLPPKRLVRLYHYDSLHIESHKRIAVECAEMLKSYDFFYHDKDSYAVEVVHATDFPTQKGVSCGTWCLALIMLLHIQFRLGCYDALKPQFYQRLRNDYILKVYQRTAQRFDELYNTYHSYFTHQPEVRVKKASKPLVTAAPKQSKAAPLSGITKLKSVAASSITAAASKPTAVTAERLKSIMYDQDPATENHHQHLPLTSAAQTPTAPRQLHNATATTTSLSESTLKSHMMDVWQQSVWTRLPLRLKLTEYEAALERSTKKILELSTSSDNNNSDQRKEELIKCWKDYMSLYQLQRALTTSLLDSEELRVLCNKNVHENISQKAVKLYASRAIFTDDIHIHACFDLDVLACKFVYDRLVIAHEYGMILRAREQGVEYTRQIPFAPYCYTIWICLGQAPPDVLTQASIFVQKHLFSQDCGIYSSGCVVYGAPPSKELMQQYYNKIMFAEHGYRQYERWDRSEEAQLDRIGDLERFMDFFRAKVEAQAAVASNTTTTTTTSIANGSNGTSNSQEEKLVDMSVTQFNQLSAFRNEQIAVLDRISKSSRDRLPFETFFVQATIPASLAKEMPYASMLLLRHLCTDPENVPKTPDEMLRYLFGRGTKELESERSAQRAVATLMHKTEQAIRGTILEHFSRSSFTKPHGFDTILHKDMITPDFYQQYLEEGEFSLQSKTLSEWRSSYKDCSFSSAIGQTLEIVERSRMFCVQMAMIQTQISYLRELLQRTETENAPIDPDYWRGEPVVSYVYKNKPEAFKHHPLLNIAPSLDDTSIPCDSTAETPEERKTYTAAISETLNDFGLDGSEYMVEAPVETIQGIVEDKLSQWTQVYEMMKTQNAVAMSAWMQTTPFFVPLYTNSSNGDTGVPLLSFHNYPWSAAVPAFTTTSPETEPLHGMFFGYINSLFLEPDSNDTVLNMAVGGTNVKRAPSFTRATFDGICWPLTLEVNTLPFEIQKVFYLFPLVIEERDTLTSQLIDSFILTPFMAYLLILHTPSELVEQIFYHMKPQDFVNKCAERGIAPRTFHTADSPFLHVVRRLRRAPTEPPMHKTYQNWFRYIAKSVGYGQVYSIGCMLEMLNSEALRNIPLTEVLLRCVYLLALSEKALSEYTQLRDQSVPRWHTDSRICSNTSNATSSMMSESITVPEVTTQVEGDKKRRELDLEQSPDATKKQRTTNVENISE